MNTNRNIPNALRTLTALILLLINSLSFAQQKNFIDQPYIETAAKVDTLVTPDRIYLEIILKESDSKNKVSVEALENRLVDRLEALNIDIDEQLSIKDASTDFRKYFLKGQGIEKVKEYQLILYDGLSLGLVLQALEKADISNIRLLKLEYSKIATLRLALKSKAILLAKQQAEAFAKPLGQEVKQAIHIADRSYFNNRSNFYEVADAEVTVVRSEAYQPKSLNIHKIEVISEISVKFALE